jgi:hypothetical protein
LDHIDDSLDALLSDHERKKQQETRRQVERALQLEADRKTGAALLRAHVVDAARNVTERLLQAGHEVLCLEHLDAYPPGIRIHLWPKPGPLDTDEPQRATLEFVWGEPKAGFLCIRRWTRSGLGNVQEQAAEPPAGVDELWAREQLLSFVREALANA